MQEDSDNDASARQRHPNLYPFLQTRLPELGLDVDTYGPYVWGGDTDDDVVEDAATSLTKDPEELQGVIDLLQASSETHSDDEEVWKGLFQSIQNEIQKDIQHHEALHAQAVEEKKSKMEQQLAAAKKQQPVAQDIPKKTAQQAMDEETKRRLMQQYGYEEPPSDADVDDTTPPGMGTSANRQVAAEANLEHAKALRAKKTTTKKEEQQKTKEMKNAKQVAKEERRKRAQKGERKR
jgi:hypothetical protein